MFDCSREIETYHDHEVRLPQKTQKTLQDHRDNNRTRVRGGLEKNGNSTPEEFTIQGSYAMNTINQHPENDYDIDDGIVFAADDLKGPKGGEMSPLDARKMVCEAVQDPAFATPPEVKTNCVRVYYAEGHHVDMPVYRKLEDDADEIYFEIASSTWRRSDPKAVTEWYNNAVIEKSPDETNGRQMRRDTRLLKNFSKSRSSWNMPSGFVLSVLVEERYFAVTDRDDESFYETISRIHSRLKHDFIVQHPVIDEFLVEDANDAAMRELRDRLEWALEKLSILHEYGCTRLKALKAWKAVFSTEYFDKAIEKEEEEAKKANAVAASALVEKVRSQPSPWCQEVELV